MADENETKIRDAVGPSGTESPAESPADVLETFMSELDKAAFIECEAGVRYWEDATVNGEPDDEDSPRIPFKVKDAWCPTINLATGIVTGWPAGTTADVHYKVCDAGRYWLLDEDGNRIATRDGYVPGKFLCHGDNGYGDYIIMKIDAEGKIADYRRPSVEEEEWTPIPVAA